MAPKNKKTDLLRTIDAKAPEGKTIAPRTLAEVDGVEHWTAETHKIWWTLLDHAWGAKMDDPKASFEIDTAALRFEGHDSNDRLAAHLLKMQKTVVSVPVENDRVLRVQMLGSTTMGRGESSYGLLRYDWPKKLVEVLRDPAKYGKIELKTVRAMRSVYGLRLYAIISARFEQRSEPEAELSLDELRSWLAVPDGKLARWADLKQWAIVPAVKDIENHCPIFSVEIEPRKVGRVVRGVTVKWSAKHAYSDIEQQTVHELNRHSAGRKARTEGTVQTVVEPFPESGRIDLGNSKWKQLAKINLPMLAGTNTTAALDLVGRDFVAFCERKAIPLNAVNIGNTFAGFCRSYNAPRLPED